MITDHHTPTEGYLSAAVAEGHVGVTSDHIGLLCRKGKIDGKRVGRVWYVREQSLIDYLQKTELERAARHRALSEQMRSEAREREYSKDEFFTLSVGSNYVAALLLAVAFAGYPALPQPLVHDTVAGIPEAWAQVYGGAAERFVDGVYAVGDLQQASYQAAAAGLGVAYEVMYQRSDAIAVQSASAIQTGATLFEPEEFAYLSYLPEAMIDTAIGYESAVGEAYLSVAERFVDASYAVRDAQARLYGGAASAILAVFESGTDYLAAAVTAPALPPLPEPQPPTITLDLVYVPAAVGDMAVYPLVESAR